MGCELSPLALHWLTYFTATNLMNIATNAINGLGLELLGRTGAPNENALLSPYSIQYALAMAYAGADGTTKAEMAKALHYESDETALHLSFAALQKSLEEIANESARVEKDIKRHGSRDPVTLAFANRLFGQEGYDFREAFLFLLQQNYRAPFQPLDFEQDSAGARERINRWVEEQTSDKIRDLVPEGALNRSIRLALVNAIYLKAPWKERFKERSTEPRPFHLTRWRKVKVPTMMAQQKFGYLKKPGMTVLTLPYAHGDLQCIIFLPDDKGGLVELERQLNTASLAETRSLPTHEVILYLPRFTIKPTLLRLGEILRGLGMRSAFDEPPGSANFDRMAPRRVNDYLCVSEVFHKTFVSLDENGTEAAAATALSMRLGCMPVAKPKPIEVHVDHPFIFAIQHAPGGACLCLGRVTDPR
ncbi:MAG TPA: serpin family protein [Candidatus Limnocylindrales bacterium]|nr:serpin family protein [Candidatus Limnocylindrales bacterium]